MKKDVEQREGNWNRVWKKTYGKIKLNRESSICRRHTAHGTVLT